MSDASPPETGSPPASMAARPDAAADVDLLLDIGAILAGDTDLDAALDQVTRRLVPRLADWATVTLRAGRGRLRRAAWAAADADLTAALSALMRRTPIDGRPLHPVTRAIETGLTQVVEEITPATIAAADLDDTDRALFERMQPAALLVQPLVARGRVVGALALGTSVVDRPLSARERRLLGDIAARIALAVDASHQRRRLQRSEQRSHGHMDAIRRLADTLTEGIVLLSPLGEVRFANRHAARLLVWDRDDLTGLTLADAILPVSDLAALGPTFGVTASTPACHRDDAVFLTRDGRVLPVAFSALLIEDGSTEQPVLLWFHDVSESRRAATAARLRLAGELATAVANDFANALTTILGRCDLYATAPPDQRDGHVAVIREQVLTAADAVRRLQTFAGASHAALQEPLDLAAIVSEAVADAECVGAAAAGRPAIRVEASIEPLSPSLGHPAEVRDVLASLVRAARESLPWGGTLTVRLERQGEWARISVAHASGSPGSLPDGIRSDQSALGLSDDGLGPRLGLAYGVLVALGGKLRAEMRPDGREIVVDLPYQPISVTGAEGRPAPTPLRLLVVDNEPALRETTALTLRLDGHDVTVAHSAMAALHLLEGQGGAAPFHLVLTDLSMPEVDGFALVRRLREDGWHVPVILTTGLGSEVTDEDVAASGATGVLRKPFTSDALRAAVRNAVCPGDGLLAWPPA